jgi:hypothetical protein
MNLHFLYLKVRPTSYDEKKSKGSKFPFSLGEGENVP